jgi:FHA domain/von Willebrand factor type A domain
VACWCSVLLIGGAWGDDRPRNFVRLERVDVEPTYAGMVLVRAFVSLTQIEGALIDQVDAKDLDLVVGDGALASVPHVAAWSDFGEPMDVVLVVEVAKQFAEAIDALNADEAMAKFLTKLPKGSRLALLTYGNEVKQLAALGDPKLAKKKWEDGVVVDDDYGAPMLIKALQRALQTLDHAKPTVATNSVRKVIIVFSDGIDDQDDPFDDYGTRERFTTKVVKPAVRAGVTIHTVGFSSYDNRPPLLNLGELSKKTAGTFRFALIPEALTQSLGLLGEQLARQKVLTYVVPAAKVPEGAKLRIYCQSTRCGNDLPLKSKERVAPAARCGGQVCSGDATCVEDACSAIVLAAKRGIGLGTWLGIGGGLLAAVVLAMSLVGRARKQREAKAAKKKKSASPQQTGAMPGVVGAAPAQVGPVVQPSIPMPGQPGYGGVASGLPAYGMRGAPPPPTAADFQPKGTFLQPLGGPKVGQQLALRHGFNIGKNAQNDLVIDDGYTSGYHAQLITDGQGGWTLVDLQSTNGTFVNGVRITQQRLGNGMSIRIGQTELRFLQG